jgi:Tfp pilus assembly protein PilF
MITMLQKDLAASRLVSATGLLVVLLATLTGAAPAVAQTLPAGDAWMTVPFEIGTASARTYWLGEGVAVLVGDELERLGLRVLPREARVGALDQLRLPTGVTLTRATYIRVGELLGARVAVFGNVETDEATITITARRLDLESGQFGSEIVETGKLTDLSAACRQMARRLSGRDVEVGAAGSASAPPLEAFEAYVKGLLADRPDARVRLLEAGRQKAPAYERIKLALWEGYTDLGEHAKALAAIDDIPDSSPVARTARFHAALSLMELKRLDAAFSTLHKLMDARPEAAVLNNLGVIQLRRGSTPQTGQATYYFNRAAELEPDDGDIFFNLGYAYWDEKDAQGAIYWLREALRRNPADADAHFVLAAALDLSASLEAGRERLLAQHLASRYADTARRPGSDAVPRGLERLKDSLSLLHPMRFDAALTAAAQRNQQELVQFHLDRAKRFLEQHRDGDAEPELRRVLFLAPYHAEAHLLVGRLYMRSGRMQEAFAAFRISLWSEETAAAHVALAQALLDTHDRAGARQSVQRALALEPDDPDARALLAHLEALPVR